MFQNIPGDSGDNGLLTSWPPVPRGWSWLGIFVAVIGSLVYLLEQQIVIWLLSNGFIDEAATRTLPETIRNTSVVLAVLGLLASFKVVVWPIRLAANLRPVRLFANGAWRLMRPVAEPVGARASSGAKAATKAALAGPRTIARPIRTGLVQTWEDLGYAARTLGSLIARGVSRAWDGLGSLVRGVRTGLSVGFGWIGAGARKTFAWCGSLIRYAGYSIWAPVRSVSRAVQIAAVGFGHGARSTARFVLRPISTTGRIVVGVVRWIGAGVAASYELLRGAVSGALHAAAMAVAAAGAWLAASVIAGYSAVHSAVTAVVMAVALPVLGSLRWAGRRVSEVYEALLWSAQVTVKAIAGMLQVTRWLTVLAATRVWRSFRAVLSVCRVTAVTVLRYAGRAGLLLGLLLLLFLGGLWNAISVILFPAIHGIVAGYHGVLILLKGLWQTVHVTAWLFMSVLVFGASDFRYLVRVVFKGAGFLSAWIWTAISWLGRLIGEAIEATYRDLARGAKAVFGMVAAVATFGVQILASILGVVRQVLYIATMAILVLLLVTVGFALGIALFAGRRLWAGVKSLANLVSAVFKTGWGVLRYAGSVLLGALKTARTLVAAVVDRIWTSIKAVAAGTAGAVRWTASGIWGLSSAAFIALIAAGVNLLIFIASPVIVIAKGIAAVASQVVAVIAVAGSMMKTAAQSTAEFVGGLIVGIGTSIYESLRRVSLVGTLLALVGIGLILSLVTAVYGMLSGQVMAAYQLLVTTAASVAIAIASMAVAAWKIVLAPLVQVAGIVQRLWRTARAGVMRSAIYASSVIKALTIDAVRYGSHLVGGLRTALSASYRLSVDIAVSAWRPLVATAAKTLSALATVLAFAGTALIVPVRIAAGPVRVLGLSKYAAPVGASAFLALELFVWSGFVNKPVETVEVAHWTSAELAQEGLLVEMAETFNLQRRRTDSGAVIQVVIYEVPSELQADYVEQLARSGNRPDLNDISNGSVSANVLDPVVISPSGDEWVVALNHKLERQVVDRAASPDIARSLIGVGTFRSMARCLGWLDSEFEYTELLEFLDDPKGWAGYECARSGWGHQTRLAISDPVSSSDGRSVRLMMYSIAAGKSPSQLTEQDVFSDDVSDAVRDLYLRTDRFPSNKANLNSKIYAGPSEANFFIVPEHHLVNLKDGESRSLVDGKETYGATSEESLVMLYPKDGTIARDYCACVVDAHWVSDAQREAASVWVEFLRSDDQQLEFLARGFRPGSGLGVYQDDSKISVSYGLKPAQEFDPIDPANYDIEVAQAVEDAWDSVKPRGIVTFVVDLSGSMLLEGKTGALASGILDSVRAMSLSNRVGLIMFNDTVNVPVEVGSLDGNLDDVEIALGDLTARGESVLYDAIMTAVEMTDAASGGREAERVVVVVTDGKSGITETRLDDLIQMKDQFGRPIVEFDGFDGADPLGWSGEVPIRLAVGAGYEWENHHRMRIVFVGIGDDVDPHVGRMIAEASGGIFRLSGPGELERTIEEITAHM